MKNNEMNIKSARPINTALRKAPCATKYIAGKPTKTSTVFHIKPNLEPYFSMNAPKLIAISRAIRIGGMSKKLKATARKEKLQVKTVAIQIGQIFRFAVFRTKYKTKVRINIDIRR